MKAIMVMFDSLNRRHLPAYGCDETHAPNFKRLAEKTLTFDRSYVCSMPCMPARRDLHTGRPNFLHSPWCPLQPYDDSMPAMLRQAGVSAHVVTDHYHYLEDGGSGYLDRYETWQCFRGQEGDQWMGQVDPPEIPDNINGKGRPQDWVNRQFIQEEVDYPLKQTFDAGMDFLERNHHADNWFLQIETFDPHEPFCAPKSMQQHYQHAGESPIFDWPDYADVSESPEEVARARDNYFASLTFCDQQLGRVLDFMDEKQLWEDTMLIVWTDHGYLLGEHNRWAKNVPKLWNEIANTPFFVWDPRSGAKGERRQALVQPSIDLGPTLLNYFGVSPTKDMTGKDLTGAIADDASVRDCGIFGYFGMPINITDGDHVYMRFAVDGSVGLPQYNWVPYAMRGLYPPERFDGVTLVDPLPFMKGIPSPCFPWKGEQHTPAGESLLFDIAADPAQESTAADPETEARLLKRMHELLVEVDAPPEVFQRYGV